MILKFFKVIRFLSSSLVVFGRLWLQPASVNLVVAIWPGCDKLWLWNLVSDGLCTWPMLLTSSISLHVFSTPSFLMYLLYKYSEHVPYIDEIILQHLWNPYYFYLLTFQTSLKWENYFKLWFLLYNYLWRFVSQETLWTNIFSSQQQ